MAIIVSVSGLEDALAAIGKVGEVPLRLPQLLNTAAEKATNAMRARVAQATTARTGKLRSFVITPANPGNLTASITPHPSAAPYAGYVDAGTPAHEIRIRNKRVLARRIGGGKYMMFGTRVWHPGTRPVYFVDAGVEMARATLREQVFDFIDGK